MKTDSSLTIFYILRHAEAENNIKNIIGANSDLTEEGKVQAKMAAEKLAHVHIDAIFSSDLVRAKNTAKIIARSRKRQVIVHKELRERNYGKYEGVSRKKYREEMKEVLKKMETMADEEIKSFRRHEGFETDKELMARFTSLLKHFATSYKGKKLLIVTHGLVMRAFLIHLGFATYKTLPPFAVDNTGYIKITCNGANFFVEETYGINKFS